eukprot:m51a1_g1544 hypothetical protein (250) ;mRNA; r:557926-558767
MLDTLSLAILGTFYALDVALYRITGSAYHGFGIADVLISLASAAAGLSVLAWGAAGAPLAYALVQRFNAFQCGWNVTQLPGYVLRREQYVRETSASSWRFMITHHCSVAAFGACVLLFPRVAAYGSGDCTAVACCFTWQGANMFGYALHHLVDRGLLGQRAAARLKFVLQRACRWGSFVAFVCWPGALDSLFPLLFAVIHLTFEFLCVRSAWRSLWREDKPRAKSPEPCADERQPRRVASTGQLKQTEM